MSNSQKVNKFALLSTAEISDFDDPVFMERLRENDENNAKLAELRQQRDKLELQQLENEIFQQTDEYLKQEEKRLTIRNAEILKTTEASKEFVTYENTEAKISEALENPKDFGYAIDNHGNIYRGNNFIKYLTATPLQNKPLSEKTAPAEKSGTLLDEKEVVQ